MFRRALLPLVSATVLLAACGGDDGTSIDTTPAAGAEDGTASDDTTAPDASGTDDTVAPFDPTETVAPLPMFGVVDTFELTIDAPAHLAGSVRLEGLAAGDPLDAPTCTPSTDFVDVYYATEDPSATGLSFDFFTISGEVDGPGTYTAAFSFESDVPPPNGGMPFTSMTGTGGELTVIDAGQGTFSVDDGYGNMITGSYACTYAG